ncbi:hypothetical protein [Modestobacter lapidis]|nr:hypothetical protein [Modestobacter lapidis]
MRSAATLSAGLAVLLLLGGCTGSPDSAEPAESDAAAPPAGPVTAVPSAARTMLADEGPVASAASMSRALFSSSPVAVVAGDADPAGRLLGASAAVGLGVPLLLGDDGATGDEVLAAELDRLGVTDVLTVGGDRGLVPAGAERSVVSVPADVEAVEEVTGLSLAGSDPVPAEGTVAAVAALDPEQPAALVPADEPPAAPSGSSGSTASSGSTGSASSGSASGNAGELPAVRRPAPLADVLVLATGAPGFLAGVATARAAGAEVRLTGAAADPRGSAEVVEALAAGPAAVVLLGADLAGEPGLEWKIDTAATGAQLPGGGQLLFPQHMMIAMYGTPGTGALGILGEQDLPAAIQRAKDVAAPYRDLVDATVVPTFEIIATVASEGAGRDGNYSNEIDPATLRPWVEAAGQAGLYVLLDLQPGRTDFVTQAQQYQALLELPHVGLALDPEWRLRPGQVHLTEIGQVGIDEVNQVVTWLADLTREKALPQKLLVLHQFQVRMLPGLERLDTSRDELAIMVHVDGQGGQAAKQSTWEVLRRDAPQPLYWGWKNFIDEDLPMLTPQETIEQVRPTPELVTYQ